MSENPYSPPQQTPAPPKPSRSLSESQIASQNKRFINYLVDRILLTGISYIVGMAIGAAVAVGGGVTQDAIFQVQLLAIAVSSIFVFLYFAILEIATGKTIGKMLTRTRVVSAHHGGPATTGQILGRTLCRYIPFEPFSFLFGDRNHPVGWHDSISNTRVIND
jgi:uncharacterized RDD family membrane protein YckC